MNTSRRDRRARTEPTQDERRSLLRELAFPLSCTGGWIMTADGQAWLQLDEMAPDEKMIFVEAMNAWERSQRRKARRK